MAETKEKKAKENVKEPDPNVDVKKTEKFFIMGENSVNALLAELTKLPWIQANPLITLLQQNLKEVKSDA